MGDVLVIFNHQNMTEFAGKNSFRRCCQALSRAIPGTDTTSLNR